MSHLAENSASMEVLSDYMDDLLAEEETAAGDLPAGIPVAYRDGACQSFDIDGFRVLLPSSEIAAIAPLESEAFDSGGSGDLLAGFYEMEAGLLPVVDLRRLLGLVGTPDSGHETASLITLKEHNYVVMVPAVGDSTRIDTSAVTWRGDNGRRPWLAGTLASSNSVLLDSDGLAALLQESL